jgi:hypothetical protein
MHMPSLSKRLTVVPWRAVAAVLVALLSPFADASVVVTHANCPANAPPPRSEICAQDPLDVPVVTHLTGPDGSLVAGGSAGPTVLRGYLSNRFGGNAHVTSWFRDDYMLVGPGSDPISFLATLQVDGQVSGSTPGTFSTVGTGFLITAGPGTHHPEPASKLLQYTGAVQDLVTILLTLPLTMTPGDTVSLGYDLLLSGTFGALLDFGSTVTLAFEGLPSGTFLRSTQGFDGVGGPPTVGTVAAPGTAPLLALALGLAVALGRARLVRTPR